MPVVISIILFLLSMQAQSSDWSCRNQDIEIRCDSNKCEESDGFTPFNIDVSDKGNITICAYSGCWEGQGKVLNSESHILLSAHNLKWTGSNPANADFIVALDMSDKVGFIKGEGFAMPITCTEN